MQNDFPAERRSMLPHGFALFSFSMFSGPILGVMTAIAAHMQCKGGGQIHWELKIAINRHFHKAHLSGRNTLYQKRKIDGSNITI